MSHNYDKNGRQSVSDGVQTVSMHIYFKTGYVQQTVSIRFMNHFIVFTTFFVAVSLCPAPARCWCLSWINYCTSATLPAESAHGLETLVCVGVISDFISLSRRLKQRLNQTKRLLVKDQIKTKPFLITLRFLFATN